MILLIGGEKGGTGKSTIATNLAVWLATAKRDVLLLDADRQGTSADWTAERQKQSDLPQVHCVQRYGNLFAPIQDLRTRYQDIIIDAGGRDSVELRSAMGIAQIFYAPAKASQSDLWTIPNLAQLVEQARAFNPALVARALITMAPTNPRVKEEKDAALMLAEFAEQLDMSPCLTRERKAYRDAMRDAKGVIELADPKATSEIQAIAQEIYGDEIQAEAISAA